MIYLSAKTVSIRVAVTAGINAHTTYGENVKVNNPQIYVKADLKEIFLNFIELIKARRSISSFKYDDISNELLEAIVDAARYTPSGEIFSLGFL